MDDRKLINQEADEMEASSNDSQDSVPENPLPLGSQALPSFSQDASLPPEPAAEQSSRPSVPTSVSEATEKIGSLLGTSRSSGCTPPPQSSSVQETLKPLVLRARKTCTRQKPQRARKTFPSRNTRVSASVSSSQDLNIVELGETSSADAPVSNQQQGFSMQDLEDSMSSEDSLGGRSSDSGVLEARDEPHGSSSSGSGPIGPDIEILESISNIQERLIRMLEEIHDSVDIEKSELSQFISVFNSFSAKPNTFEKTPELSVELRRCLKEWQKFSNWKCEPVKLAAEALGLLIRIVVQTLVSTALVLWSRSRMNLYSVMFNYRNFKMCGERFSRLRHFKKGNIPENIRELFRGFQLAVERYSLPMQNTLSELLKCIAVVDASIVYEFKEDLFDNDKRFLIEHYPR